MNPNDLEKLTIVQVKGRKKRDKEGTAVPRNGGLTESKKGSPSAWSYGSHYVELTGKGTPLPHLKTAHYRNPGAFFFAESVSRRLFSGFEPYLVPVPNGAGTVPGRCEALFRTLSA